MSLLIPSSPYRKRSPQIVNLESAMSTDGWKTRADGIANRWTTAERSERRRQGIVKRDWLIRIIDHSSNDQE